MTRGAPIRFSVATPADVDELVSDVRPEDADEILMAGMCSVEKAIRRSVDGGIASYSSRTGNDLLCLFGVFRPQGDIALIWEIGTSKLRRNAKAFLRSTPHMIRLCMDSAPMVSTFVNYLPDTYATYRKWLEKRAGAVFDDEAFPSRTGAMFRRFAITRKGA